VTAPRTVITNDHGRYEIQALSPDRCQVEAALSGFESSRATVDIDAGGTTRDLVLAVAALSERVTVTTTKAGAADSRRQSRLRCFLRRRSIKWMFAE
jgi:hypothetical protein